MSSVKVGINGFGRIGRYFLRLCLEEESIQVSSINSLGSIESSAHLLKYDSVHGVFPADVSVSNNHICAGNQKIPYFKNKDPEEILWHNTDIVLECTGRFKDKEELKKHFKNSVKKVIAAAPAEGADWTVVYGVNHQEYKPEIHHIISNASCTTNALAPLVQVLNMCFGVQRGFLTTVHSYTSGQKLLDGSHKDLRRARSAPLSMIPTTTGAGRAIEKILPSLKGCFSGVSIRVPTANVSLIDFVVQCKKKVGMEEALQQLDKASKTSLKGILRVERQPLVSCDFLGSSYSAVVDASLTKTHEDHLQFFAWYDNEAGFCHRLVDVIRFISAVF